MTEPVAGQGNGDIIDTGRVFLVVNNGSSADITVTVITPVQIDSLDLEDLTVTVAAGATEYIGPIIPRVFAQPNSSADAGRAYVEYTGTMTGVTRAVVSL